MAAAKIISSSGSGRTVWPFPIVSPSPLVLFPFRMHNTSWHGQLARESLNSFRSREGTMPKIRSFLLFLLLLLVTPTFAENTRIRDVIYGRKFGTALTMDVVKPEKQSGIGVVVMVSGGFTSDHAATDGMFSGPSFKALLDRRQALFLVVHGSQPRYIVAEINQDIHRSIRFIRSNANEYGVDANRLGVTGASSGGYLS